MARKCAGIRPGKECVSGIRSYVVGAADGRLLKWDLIRMNIRPYDEEKPYGKVTM